MTRKNEEEQEKENFHEVLKEKIPNLKAKQINLKR